MPTILQQFTSPPAQTLRTLQPTPSTIQYTVSTRPIPSTIPARLTHYAGYLIRCFVGLATALLLWTRWRLTYEKSTDILQWALSSTHEAWLHKVAESCQWIYLAPSALVAVFLALRRGYTEESLTLLRGLGVQTSTSSQTYLQSPMTRFIPTTSIQDIIIHEAFKGFEVRFYLAIVVEGEQDVVVVFPTLLPRRAILEEVWRGARKCLWEREVGERTRKDDENADKPL